MPLSIVFGQATCIGERETNEDYTAVATPTTVDLESKGLLAALADGVGGGTRGREAARAVVRGLLNDYYAVPDTWSVQHAVDTIANTLNRWLIGQQPGHNAGSAMATTMPALVLRGHRYYVAHVGDSRVYLLRDGQLRQLTTDHVWEHPDLRHVLTRAVGLDPHLVLDYASGELMVGDVFLLASDGVWEPLGEQAICKLLTAESYKNSQSSQNSEYAQNADSSHVADLLARHAIAAGGRDNASAIVLRVAELADEDLRDALTRHEQLPLPKRLNPGERIDGYRIEQRLHESRVTVLYKARCTDEADAVVIKTLKPGLADDRLAVSGLLTEEWLLRRLSPELFPQVVEPAAERNFLYYVMSWHEGATLDAQLASGKRFSALEAQEIGTRLMKGLGALHRRDILHRDIKPANLHEGTDGRLRILDLGVARFGGEPEAVRDRAGTPSYMAPELFADEPASIATDLYAAGVTLYHLLTRHYPYGEVEPFQTPRFSEPVPPSRYRPDLPVWLEALLIKAVVRDPRQRFETAEEFLHALRQGEKGSILRRRVTPLTDRLPQSFWQVAVTVSLVVNLILVLALFAARR